MRSNRVGSASRRVPSETHHAQPEENLMQHAARMSSCITIRRSRWRRHAVHLLAPLSLMLAAAPAGVSSAADAAGADALHLPASWEGKLPGADGTVHWHLDLLPEQRYRLRRTYEGKPA